MVRSRAEAVEPGYPELSISRQCDLLQISRSAYYYHPVEGDDKDLAMLIAIIKVLAEYPFYGYRKIYLELADLGITSKQVRRIMRKAGLRAIMPKRNLSKKAKYHKIYPYLLRGKNIWLPNQVWSSDITYLKIKGDAVYLVAIIDVATRKVLTWRLSNTMDVHFCIEALEEALRKYGTPAIFNTDQGSQFTADDFTNILKDSNIEISMDGKGRALDNIWIERVWRSLKYEDIFIKEYQSMSELRTGIDRYFKFYNEDRYHQSLDYETPDDWYYYGFFKNTVFVSMVA
jgi:putative transposase